MSFGIFIDTNIYLSFYEYNNLNISHLKDLLVHIKAKKINFYVTEQIIDETYRERSKILRDFTKKFENLKFPNLIPSLISNFNSEYEDFRTRQKSFEESHNILITKVKGAISQNSLEVDQLINKIFNSARLLKCNNTIIEKSHIRVLKGNPPGKKGCLRDAINWECLLKKFSRTDEDIIILSNDGDYYDEFDKMRLKPFLFLEWQKIVGTQINIYKDLNLFLKNHLPKIKLTFETSIVNELIKELHTSPNFSTTHHIINLLNDYLNDLNITQINSIYDAFLENKQIYWIASDEDIKTFMLDLIKLNPNYQPEKKAEILDHINIDD